MHEEKPFNLFMYGTLMNPAVFRAVLGKRLVVRTGQAKDADACYARRAVLTGYKKISPDSTYLYAMPDAQGRIRGYLVGGLPQQCMAALRQYEGRNYVRRTLMVQTADGSEKAIVFVGNPREMAHSFGYEFRDHFKQEVLLDRKIEAALLETEREQLHTTERITRRAVGELRGDKIRDLRRKHFDAGGISDYVIRRSLKDDPLPDFTRIVTDPEAAALSQHYLRMVVRQVLFNELEEHIHRDFRYELDRLELSHVFYERTISSLAALQMLNGNPELLAGLAARCLTALDFTRNHLVDFVRWGVEAADTLYETSLARREINFIGSHLGGGFTPLGAELEFSNIGHEVIRDPKGEVIRDARFDGFLYFTDFALDILTWKLGGHLDDHYEKFSQQPRRGFFEVALGNVSVEANLSKPITDDPWLLNQLIHQIRQFYEITPHSVHISMQARGRAKQTRNRLLPLSVMKCLFALAGDPVRVESGAVVVRRLVNEEILRTEPDPSMLFSDVSRRHSRDTDMAYLAARPGRATGRYVQQFKFLRLDAALNYEPIIMALKGLQIALSPGSFLTPAQYAERPRHRKRFEELRAWGAEPRPIERQEVQEFLTEVHRGLMTERRGQPAHTEDYIAWAINQLGGSLDKFNAFVLPENQP